MKKLFNILSLFVFTVFFAGTSAYAVPSALTDWTLDLNAVVVGLPTVDHINNLNWDSPGVNTTTIVQNLGSDGILSNGDTFTESGRMLLASATKIAGYNPATVNLNGLIVGANTYYEFVVFDDLTGSISNVNNTGDPATTTWDYTFDSGKTVAMYLTTDPDPANATSGTKILEATTTPISDGTADGFLGGPGVGDSNWALTLLASYVYPNMILDPLGNPIPANMLIGLPQGVTNIDDIDTSNGGVDGYYTFSGHTGDTMEIATRAVPEPSTLLLLGGGLLGLVALRRRKFK